MIEHQEHFGRRFYKDNSTGYWISTDYPRIRAHRWVWISIHGVIPKGYHIHHIDEDKSNNDINNLELISQKRHSRHHYTDEKRKFARELVDKIRPLTKAWHASEEGRAWHKAHGILGWINRKPIEITCKCCGKSAQTKTYHQHFCSNACKSKWRRKERLDDITIPCPICGREYTANKYSRKKTCSRLCTDKANKTTNI